MSHMLCVCGIFMFMCAIVQEGWAENSLRPLSLPSTMTESMEHPV